MTATQPAAPAHLFYPPPRGDATLIGLPRLMEMVFRSVSLQPLLHELIARAQRDPLDANALMDLSCAMHLTGQPQLGRRFQDDALAISRRYTLPARGVERLRVLSLMVPGALMDNIPIEFLLHGSDVALDMLYLDPDALDDLPTRLADLPPHDVACISVCEAPAAQPVLAALSRVMHQMPRPTLNDPARVRQLGRDCVWKCLQGVPGCVTPPSVAVDRATLAQVASGKRTLHELLPNGALPISQAMTYPLICRPEGSHAGKGLSRMEAAADLARYLARDGAEADDERVAAAQHFVVSPFIDYIGADAQYRKYRIAMVGGRPYPVHLALSARWMVHYLNGDMSDRPDNRAQEQRFLDRFGADGPDAGFGVRHAAALAAIDERLGLDYYSIDCGELPDGRLLVFEIDTGGVAHAMDPLEDFGYKRPHMLRLFAAFRELLANAAAHPGCLKPKRAAAPHEA